MIKYIWTDGTNETFRKFYLITEEYYNGIVGGAGNRKSFMPYNISDNIHDVVLAYIDDTAAACAGLKKYSEQDVEVKRVWVEPAYRGNGLGTAIMEQIERKARAEGFQRTILQTRAIMTGAVGLYRKFGYHQIPNYPPYDKLDGAVCFAKDLQRGRIVTEIVAV